MEHSLRPETSKLLKYGEHLAFEREMALSQSLDPVYEGYGNWSEWLVPNKLYFPFACGYGGISFGTRNGRKERFVSIYDFGPSPEYTFVSRASTKPSTILNFLTEYFTVW